MLRACGTFSRGVLRSQGKSRFLGLQDRPRAVDGTEGAPSFWGRSVLGNLHTPATGSSRTESSERIVIAKRDPNRISLGCPKVPFCGSFIGTSPKRTSLQATKEKRDSFKQKQALYGRM